MHLNLKGLKGAGMDLSSAHFQHTKKREYPPPFSFSIYRYIPLTQRRGFLTPQQFSNKKGISYFSGKDL